MIIEEATVREVKILSDEEKERIMTFFQGAIYCWCKNRKGEWFAARDLIGGENYYWEGTPLYILWEKHKSKNTGKEDAAKDAGWLLKKVIKEDKRYFNTKKEGLVRQYRWTGIENNG